MSAFRPHRFSLERVFSFAVGGAFLAIALASCSGAPPPSAGPPEPPPSPREELVAYARTFIGTPYRSGGTTHEGVDCSGFVTAVYRRFNVRLPRTSLGMSRIGQMVSATDIEAGDLLFFRTYGESVSHVGIYVGDGKFIHASTSTRTVRVDDLAHRYFSRRYVTARRVLDG